jgi:hypothetical protein
VSAPAVDPRDGLPVVSGDAKAAGPAPLRRLTRREYDNTVRDLLGDDSAPGTGFPDEPTGPSGFVTPQQVSGLETSRYRDAAEALAAKAVEKADLAPCAAGANQETCATQFIERFGARAFRRPLDATERAGLLTVYKVNRAAPIAEDHKGAIRVVLQAMLQAPQFLYHWELGAGAPLREGSLVRLNPYEVASRLSYFLWASMPDDKLFEAARTNALATEKQIAAEARRMVADPRAARAIEGLFEQVLETEKLPRIVKDKRVYPAWSAELATAYEQELAAFVRHAVLTDGGFGGLLTSKKSFVNEAVAKVYGATGVTGAALREVTLADARPGVLTRGAFLASQANTFESHPVLRGKVLLTRFLCTEVPPPPPGVDNQIAQPKPNQQTRERYAAHSQNPDCAGCHRSLDPLGFAFEQFDGVGGLRSMDAGRPVDASGKVEIDGKEIAFKDAAELLPHIAASNQARGCAALQWLRFGLGRQEVAADEHSLTTAMREFARSDWNLKELMIALATTKTFLYRAPAAGEMQP